MQSLFSSLRQKNSYLIRSLIKSNKSHVDYRFSVADGRKALHVTTLNTKTIAQLKDTKLTASDFEMDTLLETVLMRNAFLVRKLIKSDNVDIDCQFYDHYHGTLLHVAATEGSLDIVKILVEEGRADINMTDDLDEVPMHCAANNDHIDIVRYLAEKGSRDTEDVEHLLKPAQKTFHLGRIPIGSFVEWWW